MYKEQAATMNLDCNGEGKKIYIYIFFLFFQHIDYKGSGTALALENFTQLTHFLARHREFTALHIRLSLLENGTKAEISDCERNN